MNRFGLIISLVILLLLSPGSVAAASPFVSGDIAHTLSVSVLENGRANVYLLVNEINPSKEIQEYVLDLPPGAEGEVSAWFVDNGILQKCIQPLGEIDMSIYPPVPCWESVRTWTQAEVSREGNRLRITIPKTKGHATLGIMWSEANVTTKHWWGRTVTIRTPSVNHFLSFTNVAVSFPDGVYVRDKAVGPSNWGDMTTGVAMSQGSNMMETKGFTPQMFDRVGSTGDLWKNKSNLAPGESYAFTVQTATSRWKLFIPEIATMLGVATALVLVVSILLRLLIGRKPFWWYASVVLLMVVLVGLVFWMFQMVLAIFPRQNYPIMYDQGSSMPVQLERIEEPTAVNESP